jgi:hypothetical protein
MTRLMSRSGLRWQWQGSADGVRRGAVRASSILAVGLALSIAGGSASAQTTSISGATFSGPQTLDATSGTAVITGNATLSANTTFNLGFQLNYLVVGGGGGGGSFNGGGGGGGAIWYGSTFLTGIADVNVGGGGAGGVGSGDGSAGGDSTLSTTLLGTITATGGQGGDGSGGFGGDSGNGNWGSVDVGGGGGGGAGAAGAGVDGGVGLAWGFGDGTPLYGAGGGGSFGSGGADGGGAGGNPSGANGTAGFGAGGGGGSTGGGNGGLGTVKLAYLGSQIGTATNGTQSSGTGAAAGYTIVDYSTVGSGSFEVTSAELSSRLAATLTGGLSGSGGLTFAGPGTLTLTGNNNDYTGATQVTGGVLIVDGAITATSLTTVDPGAALGGTGSIVNVVQILAGGTVSPGTAAATGILTVGGLDLAASSTALMQIMGTTAGTGYDKIVSTGNVDYAGATLQLQMSGTGYAVGTVFDLFDASSVSGTLAAISMAGSSDGWQSVAWYTPGQSGAGTYDYGDGVWQSDWTTVGGESRKLIFNQVSGTLIVVPEPSTIAMAAAGVAGLAFMRWRRRPGRRSAAPTEPMGPA